MQKELTNSQEVSEPALDQPLLPRLRQLTLRYYKTGLAYGLAVVVIYVGLWTTPADRVPANNFDEPIWLYHSLCLDSILNSPHYSEVCRGIDSATLDHSATAKYLLTVARWWAGVPPEAAKYFSNNGSSKVDPVVRTGMIGFITILSSLTLLLLFGLLQRSFGYVAAFCGLIFLVLIPYWQFTLRAIMAEPFLMFFSVLAAVTALWLAALLLSERRRPLPLILIAAVCAGVAIGGAAGVKINAGLTGVGLVAVLIYVLVRQRRQWFLVIWVWAVVILSAAGVFYLTNPMLWDGNFWEGLSIFFTFRQVLLFNMQRGDLLDPLASLYTSVGSSYQQAYFNILPTFLSIPLSILGVWWALNQHRVLARATAIWLLTTGLINAFIVPAEVAAIGWDRYHIYTIFAIHLFTGLGAACLIIRFCFDKVKLSWLLPRPEYPSDYRHVPFIPRRYNWPTRTGAGLCVLLTAITLVTLVVIDLRGAKERKLWLELPLKQTLPQKVEVLDQLVEMNSQARLWFEPGKFVPDEGGLPLVDYLPGFFQTFSQSQDTAEMRMASRTGGLLRKYSPNSDLRELMDWRLKKLDQVFDSRLQNLITSAQFTNKTPLDLVPVGADQHQTLAKADYPIRTAITVAQDDNWRISLIGKNSKPSPIIVGIKIDGTLTGSLFYWGNDDSWSTLSLETPLKAGLHRLELVPLNGTAQIRSISFEPASVEAVSLCPDSLSVSTDTALQAHSCEYGDGVSLKTNGSEAVLTTAAPINDLYDVVLKLQQKPVGVQTVELELDNHPLGLFPVEAANEYDPLGRVNLPPLYLGKGQHRLKVSLTGGTGSLAIQQLILTPRLPDSTHFKPAQLSSAEAGYALLQSNTQVETTFKWYGIKYSFYSIKLFGTSEGNATVPVEVLLDDQSIGVVSFEPGKSLPLPLLTEMANGTTHKLTLRPKSANAGDKGYLYSVAFDPYTGPTIYAGTNLNWNKTDNAAVSSDNSVLHFGRGVKVDKTLTIAETGYYQITVRARPNQIATTHGTLNLVTDDWRTSSQSLAASTTDWTDYTFRVYLPAGSPNLKLFWDGATENNRLDLMYLFVQQSAKLKS